MGARGQEEVPREDLERILRVARRKALALGGNHHEADEVAQLTVTKLYDKWQDCALRTATTWNDARWDGYVRKVAKNVYRDQIRGYQRRLARQTKAAGRDVPILHRSGAVSAPASPDGVDAYMARATLAEEILRLPKPQRAVAIKMCIEELTAAEAAVELGIQPQSVRKHMRTARIILKQRLDEAEQRQATGA